jgi:hypothetical protein
VRCLPSDYLFWLFSKYLISAAVVGSYVSLHCYLLLRCSNSKMEFTPLSDPKRHDVNALVRVCVMRKWDFRGLANNGPIQHVDMVLADEKVCFLCFFSIRESFIEIQVSHIEIIQLP